MCEDGEVEKLSAAAKIVFGMSHECAEAFAHIFWIIGTYFCFGVYVYMRMMFDVRSARTVRLKGYLRQRFIYVSGLLADYQGICKFRPVAKSTYLELQ